MKMNVTLPLPLPFTKDAKRLAFKKIIGKAVFDHNNAVRNKKKPGTFIPARRPAKERSVEDYAPCTHCLESFIKEELFRHDKACELRPPASVTPGNKVRKQVLKPSMLLLSEACDDELPVIDKALTTEVLGAMRPGQVLTAIRRDALILKYGSSSLKKLGPRRHTDIAARMRMLGRLKIRLEQLNGVPNCHLSQFLTGPGFDKIIEAIEAECGANVNANGRFWYKNGSLATKLGHAMKKLASSSRASPYERKTAWQRLKPRHFLHCMQAILQTLLLRQPSAR
jgi:hypothetical protein